jgi:PGF-CTERM protein
MVQSRRGAVSVIRLTIVVALGTAALLLVVASTAAENTGPPVITITSGDGYASGFYTLEARVDGDMAYGSAYYGIDTADDAYLEEMNDAGVFYEIRIELGGLSDGPHTIYVKAFNSTDVSAVASVTLDVDNHSPVVEAMIDNAPAYGDYLFKGRAEDPYLNLSAVYCMIDGDEISARDNLMTKVGDHFEFTIDTTKLTEGEHLARVWAHDLWGTNNKSNAAVLFVSNRPNLVITSVVWEKTKVEADQDAVVVVTVMNQGGTAVGDFKVGIVQEDTVFATTTVEETLASGESINVTVKWSLGKEGSREVNLRVDTGEAVEEGKETDNDWSETQKVTFEGGSPGFGAVLAVIAVFVASLSLTRHTRR